jgi:hypothetical protein
MDLKPFSAFFAANVVAIVRSSRTLFIRLRTGGLQHLGAWAGTVIPGQD